MESIENIVLFGGGIQASICIDIVLKENKYHIVGIIDSKKEIGAEIYGFPIIGRQEEIQELIDKYNIQGGLITIGDNWSRKIIYDSIINKVPDFPFVNAIHPTTVIGMNVFFGFGVVTAAGCIINPNCTIGNFCLLGTGSQLEHDSVMDDFSSITCGSITGGLVHIGKFAAITLGVVVVDRIKIGENTVVGSGALVTADLPDNVLAYGIPAKVIRQRALGERFLK
jgi:sugar O-acyltransferase (sialic acid O-acetyltransferase NeuD family)